MCAVFARNYSHADLQTVAVHNWNFQLIYGHNPYVHRPKLIPLMRISYWADARPYSQMPVILCASRYVRPKISVLAGYINESHMVDIKSCSLNEWIFIIVSKWIEPFPHSHLPTHSAQTPYMVDIEFVNARPVSVIGWPTLWGQKWHSTELCLPAEGTRKQITYKSVNTMCIRTGEVSELLNAVSPCVCLWTMKASSSIIYKYSFRKLFPIFPFVTRKRSTLQAQFV